MKEHKIPIKVTKDTSPIGGEILEHESFGTMVFNRVTCSSNANLFGSSIQHHNIITLEIKRANVQRNLAQDWIHGREMLIQITMSPSQFADVITSMNQGDGVPVTIDYVNGKYMDGCPFISKRQQFTEETENEMEDYAKDIDKTLETAKAMINSNRTKGEMTALVKMIEGLKLTLTSRLPFLHKQFTRQMDKTATEAKAEVESFITGVIHKHGLDAVKEKIAAGLPLLEDSNEKKAK